jgi:hypothetical protein
VVRTTEYPCCMYLILIFIQKHSRTQKEEITIQVCMHVKPSANRIKSCARTHKISIAGSKLNVEVRLRERETDDRHHVTSSCPVQVWESCAEVQKQL